MSGAAGSKYGIINEGLPIEKSKLMEKLQPLNQTESPMVIISNQLANKCIAMWRGLGKAEISMAEQANAAGDHDTALLCCKTASEYFNNMDELIVAARSSAPDRDANLPQTFGVIDEKTFAQAVQAANAAMQRFNNHVKALRYALPNISGSGNEIQSTELDRAQKDHHRSPGIHAEEAGEKTQNQ